VWTAGFLTFASPSLATVVPGLPNDHYHAFADPMVFTIAGIGAAILWRWGAAATARTTSWATLVTPGRILVVVATIALVAFNLVRQPPARPSRRRLSRRRRRARRIIAAGGDELTLRSIPGFKSTEAYGYPLVRAGCERQRRYGSGPVTDPVGSLVVICDSLFEQVVARRAAAAPRPRSRRRGDTAIPWTGSRRNPGERSPSIGARSRFARAR
jgi:hypothetical protein